MTAPWLGSMSEEGTWTQSIQRATIHRFGLHCNSPPKPLVLAGALYPQQICLFPGCLWVLPLSRVTTELHKTHISKIFRKELLQEFPWQCSGWNFTFQCRGYRFNPWLGSWDPICPTANKSECKQYGPRVCPPEWSKSKRGQQIPYY